MKFENNKMKHKKKQTNKRKLYKYVKVSEFASYDVSSSTINETHIESADTNQLSSSALEYPKMVASCFCARKPEYYLANAYLLIFLITASSLTVFSISFDTAVANRLQITYVLLLTR